MEDKDKTVREREDDEEDTEEEVDEARAEARPELDASSAKVASSSSPCV
jgi:hypothetical protein